jgi:hypothetical protein
MAADETPCSRSNRDLSVAGTSVRDLAHRLPHLDARVFKEFHEPGICVGIVPGGTE